MNNRWKTWIQRIGIAGFLFFLIKGLIWLFLIWGGTKWISTFWDK